jgi:hypothetical protein
LKCCNHRKLLPAVSNHSHDTDVNNARENASNIDEKVLSDQTEVLEIDTLSTNRSVEYNAEGVLYYYGYKVNNDSLDD